MYTNLGIQEYSVRNHLTKPEEVKETFEKLAEMGYSQIQTANNFNAYSASFYAQCAKEAGLEVIGTHYSMPKDVNDIEEYVNLHRTLGTVNAGIGGNNIKITADVEPFIESVNKLADNLAKYGMKFTYHHHSFEFSKIAGIKGRLMDIYAEKFNKNVSFVLDTYWLNNAGLDVNEWIERLAGRCDILHIKDCGVKSGTSQRFITEIGNGNIEFKKILKTAEKCGVKYICVEQDEWPEDSDSLISVKQSADYFKNVLIK